MHPWLRGDYAPRLEPIDMMRYIPIRDKIRAKYKEWEKFLLPIGRLAEYSSLRKLHLEKYRIHDTQFGELGAGGNRLMSHQNRLCIIIITLSTIKCFTIITLTTV